MSPLLRWEAAAFAFFAYTVACAFTRTGRAAPARRRSLALAAAGLALTSISATLPRTAILHDWLIPPALLLLGYWSSGALFAAPMPALERWLLDVDHRLGILRLARRTPPFLADVLEAAYAGIYALVPIALAVHLAYAPHPSAERFWTTVLTIDFVCFGCLPWLQTRPPRSLETDEPWTTRLRTLNRAVVDSASIRVNTIPSGHAAEGLALALLVVGAPPAVVAAMLACGLAVAAGAVLGRYHYAVDAMSGWAVAVVVWLAIR